jgi:hypothetical protein
VLVLYYFLQIAQKGSQGVTEDQTGPIKEQKPPKGANHSFGALGATPDGCTRAHPSENKHVISLKKQYARGQAAEPPNMYQKYLLGRLGGDNLGHLNYPSNEHTPRNKD